MESKLSAKYLEKILSRSMLHNIIPSYLTLLDIRQVIMNQQLGDMSKYIEIKKLVTALEDSLDDLYAKKD